MNYGQRWKSAREAAGFSVQQAAEAVGVHRNAIYKLESGADVTLRLMRDAAAAYGVTFGQVFADESQPERVPSEFRPLLEPLLPLTQQQREAIIRNIAASLSFMQTLYGTSSRTESRSIGEVSDDRNMEPNHTGISSVSPAVNLTHLLATQRMPVGESTDDERIPRTKAAEGRESKKR